MVFILPDGAAHAMVDILGAGPVIVEFGVVEGLLPTGKIEKGGVQLAGRFVLQFRAPRAGVHVVIHVGLVITVINVVLDAGQYSLCPAIKHQHAGRA